jgi:para-nitrobenzyl esterase
MVILGNIGDGKTGFGMKCRIASSLMVAVAFGGRATTPSPAVRVQTDSGLVEGVQEDAAVVFKGIPFAAPPVGDRRWRPPQAPSPWTGVRKADRFSPVCVQNGSYPPDAPPEPVSEDCLYLNVWVPIAEKREKLAVMVWIYGGGLQNGSASTSLYAGDKLARKGVILVTANYRLGVFGFLAHPDLTSESEHHSSGNYGLLDQIAALSWVHRNIAAFGGDPDRVTVFGQSSGSISISALATSPLAKGLFQRAIGESGGLFEPLDLAVGFKLPGAEQEGKSFASRAGATTLAALRRRPATELMKTPFDAHLIVDGFALAQPPYDAYRKGQQNDVALLLGSNADEGQTFIADRTITVENFTRELDRDFPDGLVRLIGPQPGTTDSQARASAAAFERDMRFRWDMWTWARLGMNAGRRKVFFYQFSRVPPYRAGDKYFGWGASHGMEIPYVFDHLDQQALPWTIQDRRLASAMSSYWTNFAKFGDPNGSGQPFWPEVTSSSQQVMQLGAEIKPEALQNEDALKRIDRVYEGARLTVKDATGRR